MTPFGTVIADPPWKYRDQKLKMKRTGKGAAAHYETAALDPLRALGQPGLICGYEIANDAHLWMWTTNAFMEEALVLARAWGFTQKTILTWIKGRLAVQTTADGRRAVLVQHIGQGSYLRNSTEHVLFCVRGRAPLPKGVTIPTAFVYPARWRGRRNSEKPPVIHRLAERTSPGPRLELFARAPHEGWTVFGHEVSGHDPFGRETILVAETG
jgi:N6-adenosine-specific RNA methylase IME4